MKSPRIFFVLGILTGLVACGGSDSGTVPPTSNLPQFYKDNYATQATSYTGYASGACHVDIPADSNVTAIKSSTYDNISLCGAYITVTGDKGTATVKVVDVCPTCPNNDHLDLSDVAYNAIASVVGTANVTWNFVQAPVGTNNIKLHVDASVNAWYMNVVIDDHRHPVETVEIQDSSSTFVTLTRDTGNRFAGSPSVGNTFQSPAVIRITDRFGNQIEESVTWTAGTTTTTSVQFPEYQ